MQKEFENALENLLELNLENPQSEGEAAKQYAERYNEAFRRLINVTMQICSETDFAPMIQTKVSAAEEKFGCKMETSDEVDVYKKLREVVRFEMARDSIRSGKEHEICCTESNFNKAMSKIRGELEAIVPEGQVEVVESMGQALYSDFTQFFVSATLDMIADAIIYQTKEFRPLQLNAMGKEIRTYVNVIRQQNEKPQKSETATNWFRVMMMLPALLFKRLYAVDFVQMFDVPQAQMDAAAKMFENFEAVRADFSSGDEYKVLNSFLIHLGLEDSFTVRPKLKKPENKPLVN